VTKYAVQIAVEATAYYVIEAGSPDAAVECAKEALTVTEVWAESEETEWDVWVNGPAREDAEVDIVAEHA
jgi:hypothetical protein